MNTTSRLLILKNQAIVRDFYAVLKSAGPDLRFLFITGISKFAKVSIFSVLNNLDDITLNSDFSTMAGYTQQELEFYFEDYLKVAENKHKISREVLLDTMRTWYNGFSWDGEKRVYNPFGILSFFRQQKFKNYWFATGTPTFLLTQMRKREVFNVENTAINGLEFEKYDLENLDLIPLLFQSGYLTIKTVDEMTDDMVLDYPNKEVRDSMYRFLIGGLTKPKGMATPENSVKDILESLRSYDLENVRLIINALLSGLPYETYKTKSEGLYHGLIHLIFKLMGTYVQSEVHSSKGRADSVVHTETDVFIFEFKFNKTADEAINQIERKKYADAYRASGKRITGIGINFNTLEKEIDGWLVKIL
jgi:hypothetical protein